MCCRVYGYCKSEVQTSVGADVYRSITPDSLESHINTTNHHNQSSSILPVREEANKVIADSRPSCQRVLLNFSDEVTSRGRHSDMKIAEETTPSRLYHYISYPSHKPRILVPLDKLGKTNRIHNVQIRSCG